MLPMPEGLRGRRWREILTGRVVETGAALDAATLFRELSAAVLFAPGDAGRNVDCLSELSMPAARGRLGAASSVRQVLQNGGAIAGMMFLCSAERRFSVPA
jgi:D-alanyl-D-alanine dipeptidase